MRAPASLTILCLTGFAAAQDKGYLGTKSSPVTMSNGQGGIGIMPILQMGIALGVVLLLLKFVLPKMMGKMNKKLATSATGGLKVEESATFAGGTLYIVRARSKTLLLSVSAQGVNCLSDLTEESVSAEAQTEFERIIDQSPGKKLPEPTDLEVALERLERLSV